MNPNLYPNGTPFENYEIVEKNIIHFILRKDYKHPILIIIDGGLSTGKTTADIEIGDLINKKHGLPEIDLTKETIQYAIGGEDFVRKLKL